MANYRRSHRLRDPSPNDSDISDSYLDRLSKQYKCKDPMANHQRLKVAIVTGASAGIGKASAIKLSSEGWAVVLSARREAELKATADLCSGETLTVVGDVGKEDDVLRLFEATIQKFGRLDLLFNNAGIGGTAQAIDEITSSNLQSVLDVNVIAAVLCSREAFKIFKKQEPTGGRIINNGSLAAFTPRPSAGIYSISKHATTGLTKAIALDGRPYNITATQFDIGNAATDMASHSSRGTLQADRSIKSEPLMDVNYVAESIAHIASLPNEVTVLEHIIMATGMPFVGRG